jgi:hypothetical protein
VRPEVIEVGGGEVRVGGMGCLERSVSLEIGLSGISSLEYVSCGAWGKFLVLQHGKSCINQIA